MCAACSGLIRQEWYLSILAFPPPITRWPLSRIASGTCYIGLTRSIRFPTELYLGIDSIPDCQGRYPTRHLGYPGHLAHSVHSGPLGALIRTLNRTLSTLRVLMALKGTQGTQGTQTGYPYTRFTPQAVYSSVATANERLRLRTVFLESTYYSTDGLLNVGMGVSYSLLASFRVRCEHSQMMDISDSRTSIEVALLHPKLIPR